MDNFSVADNSTIASCVRTPLPAKLTGMSHFYRRPYASRPVLPMTSPGQLIAALPALLGFYPHESLVLVTFHHETSDRYCLGPIVRIDTEDVLFLEPEDLPLCDHDLLLAFLISEGGPELVRTGVSDTDIDRDDLDRLIHFVDDVAEMYRSDLVGFWATEEVISGEPVVAVHLGPDFDLTQWQHDHVSTVTESPAMDPWIATGQLPEVDRDAALSAVIDPNPYLSDQARRNVLDDAQSTAKEAENQGNLAALVTALSHVALPGKTVEDHLQTPDALTACLAALQITVCRDSCVADILLHPTAYASLLLAGARTAQDSVRADALALYAIARIAQGFPMAASPAIMAALKETPGHTLSQLILQASTLGAYDPMLRGFDMGSREARARLGIQADDSLSA
ncbi:DUF4192 domain-containing protein [Corynebacterium tapiri]|uniref:DUF4192 domain-containing protein n=1 Tax=Corynebacterium tapiri TaxID=1448266 RepID=UPI0015D592AF|nr:DUF4192 domain-containing protein [Corynebacterium tapiri]